MVPLRPHLASTRYAGKITGNTPFVRILVLACLILFLPRPVLHSAEPAEFLNRWLDHQTNLHAWSADFTQTRSLRTLTRPLTATGHVWFAAPGLFRWELGQPPQTIAVRQTNQIVILYPKLRRAETYPLDGEQAGPWRDALALLEAGFPRSRPELENRFLIRGIALQESRCEVDLEPRSAGARRMMPLIRLGFSTNDLNLVMTELRFADGSTLRNDFTNMTVNPELDETLFQPEIPDGFKVVSPRTK
ncbi:MAG TPA: outer membrane lipoprotein carrier protein LolA [Methylomirabilota bacterium]|nr:outer membrane lipoprotein carrier protein LolA [Methylomirabilota bacterium]